MPAAAPNARKRQHDVADPDETPNTSRRSFDSVKERRRERAVCYSSRALSSGVRHAGYGSTRAPFGFSPKISTPVENTVEKHRETAEVLAGNADFIGDFWPGEGLLTAVFRASAATSVIRAGRRRRFGEAKVFDFLRFFGAYRHGRQHLGPGSHPDRDQG